MVKLEDNKRAASLKGHGPFSRRVDQLTSMATASKVAASKVEAVCVAIGFGKDGS